jgi:hypothetical protein
MKSQPSSPYAENDCSFLSACFGVFEDVKQLNTTLLFLSSRRLCSSLEPGAFVHGKCPYMEGVGGKERLSDFDKMIRDV